MGVGLVLLISGDLAGASVGELTPYFDYRGSLQVRGRATVAQIDQELTELSYWLTGVDPLCALEPSPNHSNSCGVHVHEGTSCSADALGHFYNGEIDPWKRINYAGNSTNNEFIIQTSSVSGSKLVKTLLEEHASDTRTLIVHDFYGKRVACGKITASMDAIDCSADSFDPYFTYSGNLTIHGRMTMRTVNGKSAMVYHLSGFDPECSSGPGNSPNSCGVHIHRGRSCSGDALGHFYNHAADPWMNVSPEPFNSSEITLVGSSIINTGFSAHQADGHTLIVHDYSGARVACALVQKVAGGGECQPSPSVFEEYSEWPDNGLSTIYSLHIFSATLSLCGSIFIIFTFHYMYGFPILSKSCFTRLACIRHGAESAITATSSSRIVYWISVADVGTSITYLIDGSTPFAELDREQCGHPTCAFLGIMQQFWGLAGILWISVLAYNMQLVMLPGSMRPPPEKFIRQMHKLVWGLSAITILAILPLNGFGTAGNWCWIRDQVSGLRFLLFYFPLFSTLAYTIYVYATLRKRILSMRAEINADNAQGRAGDLPASDILNALTNRFRNYVIIFVIVWAFAFLNRMHGVLFPDTPSIFLYDMSSLFTPLAGLGNALVYGVTQNVKDTYAERCGCMKKPQVTEMAVREANVTVEAVDEMDGQAAPDGFQTNQV